MFVDHVKVHVTAGRGGNGVTSFARQPFEPRGRPDGGDGGHGGSVLVRACSDVATLVDYHHRPHRAAGDGRHGQGDLRRGADGPDTILQVPVGTVVRDADGTFLADLLVDGDELVALAGGRGGRGNAAFASAQRRGPRFHELGEPGRQCWLVLELKLVTDVALVGYPNAGKSSLISRLSAAKPKIADYPFTTLAPNLGVVKDDDVDYVVADVPGLIEGASAGRGLGHEFLRHVERAGVLVHVLDCANYEQRDPREDLAVIVDELTAYQPDLVERPSLVWLNKVDADRDTAEIIRPDLEAAGHEVLAGSAVTGEGLDALRHRLSALVALAREQHSARAEQELSARPVLRPVGERVGEGFTVESTPEGFRVTGERVERWVVMTDLDNDEAVRHLQGRLTRAGVERALVQAGADRGDTVEIAGAQFAFEPEAGEMAADEGDAETAAEDTADDASDAEADA